MSSLFSQASLVVEPAVYEDGLVYATKPFDGSGDFTFSRGSDIEATRVASNGYIQKAKVNLLLQSNSFDTTWIPSNVSTTGGQAGYDGSNDAWLINITGGTSAQRVNQTISASGVLTLSVYAKAGTLNWISVRGDAPAVSEAYFNLSTGALGSLVGSAIDSSIESVGSGWYRCSVSFVDTTIVRIYLASGDNNITQSSGNIYIQDAQLNYGLVAQEYQETTTTSVVSGITNDLPRLDYSGGASCPRVLLESERQNLIPHSEYIGDSGWSKTDATITTNAAISPEGVQNASLITFASGGFILESITTTKAIGDKETISVFSNADISGTFLKYGGGTAAGTDVEGREVIGNGWFRYYVTRTFTEAETASTQLIIAQSNVGNSVLIYGASLEKGSLSSYIPTYGTSNSRLAESCSKTGIASLIGQSEGVLFVDWVPQNNPIASTQQWLMFLGSGSTYISIFTSSAGKIRANVANTTDQCVIDTSYSFVAGTRYKCALAYKANDFAFYVNGVLIGTDTSGTVPAVSTLQNNYNTTAANRTNAGLNQMLLFKTRLSNSDLATLTSL